MTFRAVVLGLVGTIVLCAVTFFNDMVLQGQAFIGSYLPLAVFGGLFIAVLLVNPLLGLIRKRWALTGSELALIMVMLFAASYVPGRGLMRNFTSFLMIPHDMVRNNPDWRRHEVISKLTPKQMLANPKMSREERLAHPERDPEEALNGFKTGPARPGQRIGMTELPWYAWWRTLGFWLPLLLSISVAMIGLALVIHRQWAHHEHLRYPIVTFAQSLLPPPGRVISPVLRNRAFWLAAGCVIAFNMCNYVGVWYEGWPFNIPRHIWLRDAAASFPTFVKGGGFYLLAVRFWFLAIGVGFLLATDVAMSLGIAPFLYTYIVGFFALRGLNLHEGGEELGLSIENFLHIGAYLAMFLALVYMGRRYYANTLRRALFLPSRDKVAPHAVWGARAFMVGIVLFVVQLTLVGLDWQLAVLYTMGAVVAFVGFSRLVAETGMFYLHLFCFPCVAIWGFMGAPALGPKTLLILFMVSSILLVDPRETLMPFIVNGLQLADKNKVNVGKAAMWALVAVVVGVAVALPMTLYWQYNLGVDKASDWGSRVGVPRYALNQAAAVSQELKTNEQLDHANSLTGWERFSWKNLSANRSCVAAFWIAFVAVGLVTTARLRYSWWPLHPVILMVPTTWQSKALGASFLLGGLMKIAVNKFGGGKAYQRCKSLAFGLIAGDLISAFLIMIIGTIYFYVTNEAPKPFKFMLR